MDNLKGMFRDQDISGPSIGSNMMQRQFGLENNFEESQGRRLQYLMEMLKKKNPRMPFNQLLQQATGMLRQFDNYRAQDKRSENNQTQQLGMTY